MINLKFKYFIIFLICLIILVIGIVGQVHIYYVEFLNQIKLFGFYKSDITTLDLHLYDFFSVGLIIIGIISSVACLMYYLFNCEVKK